MQAEAGGRRVALVTGASRGLGAEVALALAEGGLHVVAAARTQGALEALDDRIREAGGTATLAPLDLTQAGSVEALAGEIRSRFGRLDVLVHAAGDAARFTPVRDVDPAEFERLWRLNADAARALMSAFESPLSQSRGRARFVCDRQVSGAYRGAYAATKAALRALVEAWRAECPQIDVAAFDPPPMATALRAQGHPGERRENLADPRQVARVLVQGLVLAEPAA